MIKFLSEDIFSDRNKNGSDLYKKIDIRHNRFYKFKAWSSPNLSFFWRNFVCEPLSWVQLHD